MTVQSVCGQLRSGELGYVIHIFSPACSHADGSEAAAGATEVANSAAASATAAVRIRRRMADSSSGWWGTGAP